MAGLLGGIAGLAEATTKIAGREIERRGMDIKDAALLRREESLAELRSSLTAGREEVDRAAASEEKRKEREFKIPKQEAEIGLLKAQTEKAKRQKAPSTAARKLLASQAFERVGATFKHSGVELILNEDGEMETIEGSATAEQLKPLIAKASAEGFDLVTSKGELIDSGFWAAIVGEKAKQMINFTVVPSGGGLGEGQLGISKNVSRLAGLVNTGRTGPAEAEAFTEEKQEDITGLPIEQKRKIRQQRRAEKSETERIASEKREAEKQARIRAANISFEKSRRGRAAGFDEFQQRAAGLLKR